MNFSKEELETVFHYKKNDNYVWTNEKTKQHELRWSKNILEIVMQIKNPLFFMALIEKKAFEHDYNPVVKQLITNISSKHSLEFYEMLYQIQTDYDNDKKQEIGSYIWQILTFCQLIDTEEKKEFFCFFVNELSKKPDSLIDFIVNHTKSLDEEKLAIIKSTLDSKKININDYDNFPMLPKNERSNFFISNGDFERIHQLVDFGFNFNNYKFNKKSLIMCLFKYTLDYSKTSENFAVPLLQKMLRASSEDEINRFFEELYQSGEQKINRYEHYFKFIPKEKLNDKLEIILSPSLVIKQPKI